MNNDVNVIAAHADISGHRYTVLMITAYNIQQRIRAHYDYD